MDDRTKGLALPKKDLVSLLCELHGRMIPSRYDRSWRPLRIEVTSSDADTVLQAAIALDRVRIALGQAGQVQMESGDHISSPASDAP